ncbi:MAG TPA: HPr(Ser) kinase/phosphatase, partial [Chromatiales bacterium]|nr:HPr(Ser) kinase/phosphatase [Chromatiales bacterium]
MSANLTARAVFDKHQKTLELEWLSGQDQADRTPDGHDLGHQTGTLVGHLNLIRPNLVQVLGRTELAYLEQLGKNSRQDALRALFAGSPLLLVIAEALRPDPFLLQQAQRHGVPLATTPRPAAEIIDHLRHHIASQVSEKLIQHGVFMEVMGLGVLLSGPAGVGKSELALE